MQHDIPLRGPRTYIVNWVHVREGGGYRVAYVRGQLHYFEAVRPSDFRLQGGGEEQPATAERANTKHE